MIEISRKGEWWYGAGASFPKGVEWANWYALYAAQLAHSQPWERFIVDSTVRLQQTLVKMGQIIRKNLDFTKGYTEGNLENVLALAEAAAMWYRKSRPSDDTVRALAPEHVMLFHGLDGAFNVMERLGIEIDQIKRRGYFLIDTGAESAALSRS